MNKEKQRIKIAEACGWEFKKGKANPNQTMCREPGITFDCWWATDILPDYLNDLNAMHEAEKTLEGIKPVYKGGWMTQFDDYEGALLEIVQEQGNRQRREAGCTSATAAQRAEAFLKTLGLWTEEDDA